MDITVGMHASDDGLTRYYNLWEGQTEGEHLPFVTPFALPLDIMHMQGRGIFDTVASLLGHGLLLPVPDAADPSRSRTAAAGCGRSSAALEESYAKTPLDVARGPADGVQAQRLDRIPSTRRTRAGSSSCGGADRVVFGSDYPHIEGMSDPLSYVDELAGLPHEDIARVMGGNLAEVMKLPFAA